MIFIVCYAMMKHRFTVIILLVSYHTAQAVARVQRNDGIVGKLDPVEQMRNVVINGDLSVKGPLHEPWDILRLEASKGGSFPNAASHKLERASLDLVPRSCNSNHAGHAPPAVAALKRSSHHLYIAGAIEAVVHSPLRHDTSNVLLDRNIQLLWVDKICSPKASCDLVLGVVDINADDARSSGHLGGLNDGQALLFKSRGD